MARRDLTNQDSYRVPSNLRLQIGMLSAFNCTFITLLKNLYLKIENFVCGIQLENKCIVIHGRVPMTPFKN